MRHLISSCCLLASCTLTAQIAPFAYVDTLAVSAGGVAAAPVPAGADVWSGVARSASGAVGSAGATLVHTLDTAAVELDWQLVAVATVPGTCTAAANVRYELVSVPQDGVLLVEWLPAIDDDGAASLQVDVGDDGVVDATGSATIPIAFGGAPFALRVHADVRATAGSFAGPWGTSWSWDSAALAELRVLFVPTHATTTVVAPASCAPAPTLQGLPDLLQGVELRATAAAPADLMLFVLGFAPANAPLPAAAGCALLVDPAAILWAPIAADGLARLSVAVPPPARPATFYAQAIAVDLQPFALRAGASARSDVF